MAEKVAFYGFNVPLSFLGLTDKELLFVTTMKLHEFITKRWLTFRKETPQMGSKILLFWDWSSQRGICNPFSCGFAIRSLKPKKPRLHYIETGLLHLPGFFFQSSRLSCSPHRSIAPHGHLHRDRWRDSCAFVLRLPA